MFNTPVNDALNLPVSVAKQRIDSKEFENWQKTKEAEFKNYAGMIERLNQVIVGINYVCKTVNGSATSICKTIGNTR